MNQEQARKIAELSNDIELMKANIENRKTDNYLYFGGGDSNVAIHDEAVSKDTYNQLYKGIDKLLKKIIKKKQKELDSLTIIDWGVDPFKPTTTAVIAEEQGWTIIPGTLKEDEQSQPTKKSFIKRLMFWK